MQPIPIQGASSQDNTTMYIVMMLLCCCCLSSSSAGGFLWTRMRSSGNMIQGYPVVIYGEELKGVEILVVAPNKP